MAAEQTCLSVEDLQVRFDTVDGTVNAVNGVSFEVRRGEVLGVVGESGSGKSVTMMATLGLVEPPGRTSGGRIMFDGRDLTSISAREMRRIRGARIGLVSQDPMTSFNPVLTIGAQISEAIRLGDPGVTRREARTRAISLLESVGVPDPDRRFDQYPHEYSGGMRQRAMIAMAMSNQPELLIADEPTTALDVTIQAQVLDVLKEKMKDSGSSTILITHDLGVIAEMAHRVVVMYAGRVVEQGDVRSIFHAPQHPYTVGLMRSLPRLEVKGERLTPIPGNPPSALRLPPGCPFEPRCGLGNGDPLCVNEYPATVETAPGRSSACHHRERIPLWIGSSQESEET